jgi:putative transcriptional regulator
MIVCLIIIDLVQKFNNKKYYVYKESCVMYEIGQVVLKIDKLLERYNMSTSKFARETKIQYKQAKSYCKGDMQKVDLVILARICHTFECSISDILEYIL